MANGRRQYKKMPNSMMVQIFFPQVEDDAQKIKCSPDTDHDQYRSGYGIKECTSSHNENASHCDIDQGGNHIPFAGKKNLENDA